MDYNRDMDIAFLNFRVKSGSLPGPSVFRSALGPALRNLCCAWPDRECRTCPRAGDCLYAAVFEPGLNRGDSGPSTPPVPFVIRRFEGNGIEIALFGPLALQYRTFAVAVNLAMHAGLGHDRQRFFLKPDVRSVIVDRDTPWCRKTTLIQEVERVQRTLKRHALRVATITPVRLASDGREKRDLDIGDLVAATVRRSKLLLGFYGRPVDTSPLSQVLENTSDFQAEYVSEFTVWRDGHRYSSRQGRRVPLGGVEGFFYLDGVSDSGLSILALARILGVGKGTAQGLGMIDVSPKTRRNHE